MLMTAVYYIKVKIVHKYAGFTKSDVHLLNDVIYSNFNVQSRVVPKKESGIVRHRIFIPEAEAGHFIDLIKPIF